VTSFVDASKRVADGAWLILFMADAKAL
jgi:hypothetical protein